MAKKTLTILLVLIFPIAWILFLNQNVPFSTMDDPTIHYLAKTTPFSKIVSRILNPLTPAWTYQFQSLGGEQNSLGLRPVELFIWKTLQTLFGYRLWPFYFVKALFLGLVSSLIYIFCIRITRNRLVSCLASLFYATTLSSYCSVTVITVFDLLAQFIQGIAALVFLDLVLKNHEEKVSSKKTLLSCSLLFVITWLAIKTYETTKLLPALFACFLAFMYRRQPRTWLSQKNNQILLFTVLLMSILVVPFTASYKVYDTKGSEIKNETSLPYHWNTLYRFTLQNTRNAWEPEKDVAFFSLTSYLPFSIARTFGLFLCWLLVFGWGAFFWNIRRVRLMERSRKFPLVFVLVWSAAVTAALGLPKESDGRHLMAPLIPITILGAFLLWWAHRHLPARAKKAFAALCLFGWAFAFVTNAGHNIYFRKFIGGTQIAQDKYLSYLYKDFHRVHAHSYDDLIRFMRVPEALCIWHIPFIVDDLYGNFDEKIKPANLSDIHALHGKAYIVTTDPERIPDDPRYAPMAQFDEMNESLYTDWVLRFKKKKGSIHYVYQFVPVNFSASRPSGSAKNQ